MFRETDFIGSNYPTDLYNQYSDNRVISDIEQEKFYQLVFSPDPETGNPCSDVRYLLKGTDEGFKQFIKDKLFKANPEVELAETAEEAELLLKKNIMTSEQYAEYVKEYVTNMYIEENAVS